MPEYLFNLDTVGEQDVDGVVTIKPNLWLLSSEDCRRCCSRRRRWQGFCMWGGARSMT